MNLAFSWKRRIYLQTRSYKKDWIDKLGSSKYEKSNVEICSLIESRMNETIQEINKTDSIFDSDKLHSELRILDWIFYQVCIIRQVSNIE